MCRFSMPDYRWWMLGLVLVSGFGGESLEAGEYDPAGCLNDEELELARLINDYRGENGLDPVPLSSSLTLVAQWHLADFAHAIQETGDYGSNASCNLHTWYGIPDAPYTTCCYTSDHAEAACMWNKPKEVTGNVYTAPGFEISAGQFASVAAALQGWKGSPGHDDVILNKGTWAGQTWRAMGVGVDPSLKFYFVWFGTQADPNGAPIPCQLPQLEITLEGSGQVKISWTPDLPGWVLQESTSLTSASWVDSPAEIVNGAIISTSSGEKYYRLAKP